MPRRVAAYVSQCHTDQIPVTFSLSADLIWLRFEFEINLCSFDEFPQLPPVSMEKIVISLLLNLKSGKGMISGGKQIINRGPIGEDVALRNLFYAVLFNSLFQCFY